MNRREFVKISGLSLLAAPSLFGASSKASGMMTDEVGIILNTVKHSFKADHLRTLTILKEMGYDYVEGNSMGLPHEQFVNSLKSVGLPCVATGTAMYQLLNETDAQLKAADELGCQYVVCYWPWMGDASNLNRDDFMVAAEHLNKVGEICKRAGFRFAFHNHDKEFKVFEEQIGMDLLLENTDPALVDVEFDLYWVQYANFDPIPFFNKHPGRFKLFHLKDMDASSERSRTCVGQGVMDFKRILQAAELSGVKHLIVEKENAVEGEDLDCAISSIQFLKSIKL